MKDFAQVSFATNGNDTLRLAELQPPDLILLDIEMPGRNGFDVCWQLRQQPELASVPIIFATSHVDPACETRALELGADDFLHKPFDPVQVMSRLRVQLQTMVPFTPPVTPAAGQARILMVDDDFATIQVLRRLLKDVGECHFTMDSQQAVGLAHELRPDLILLDIGMPNSDGFHLCKQLRADPALQHVPIVFLTQSHSVLDEARALALGGDDFLRKPFNAGVLQARVRRLVTRKRAVDLTLSQAEQQRRKLSDSRMAAVIAPCKDAIVIADTQDQIVLANAAASQLFGIEVEPLRRLKLGDLLQRCDGAQRTVRHALGHDVPVDVSVATDGSGPDAVTVLVLRDALARSTPESLARPRDPEAARRSTAALLACIAGDMTDPLHEIHGFAQLAQLDPGSGTPEQHRRWLGHVQAAADRLLALAHDLQDLAALESGQRRVAPVPMDLVPAVRDACRRMQPRADRPGMTVSLRHTPATLQVLADPASLQQCLGHLLSCALGAVGSPRLHGGAGGSNSTGFDAGGDLAIDIELQDGCALLSLPDPGPSDEAPLAEERTAAPEARIAVLLARDLAQAMGAVLLPSAPGAALRRFQLQIPRAPEIDSDTPSHTL